MVSMKDISKACGYSVATVSKALNDHSDVGEETKEKIKEVAKQMGYFPNAMARALKTNRTYNIGVLFMDEARSGLTHDYFSTVLDSFKRAVEEKGYDITFLTKGQNGLSKMSYLEHCRYRGFDGVVIACVDFYDPQVVELVRSNIPVVTIDHLMDNRINIMSDNVNGMQQILQYVYDQGHRKIAYIHGAYSSVTQARLSSFYYYTDKLGLDIPQEYIKESPYRDTTSAGKCTGELLDLKNPPTCILYPDDFSSFGGMNEIRRRGLRIPTDVSIVGYDGISLGRHIEPKLTTLQQDSRTIGTRAAEKLIELIENPKSTFIEQVVVPGKIYEGQSVQKLND